MNQPTLDHKPQRNQEKEPYITPELDKQEPLLDITATPIGNISVTFGEGEIPDDKEVFI